MEKKLKYLKYYAKVLLNNWTIKKDSYAQHGEDKLVEQLLPNGVHSFIDIGANDGVLFSNTYKFAKLKARGLCIEPVKNSFFKLKLNHIFHPKVKCINSAISDLNEDLFIQEKGYESTLSEITKNKTPNSYKVRAYTFENLLKKYPSFHKIDFLSVDVEGHEKEVFNSLHSFKFYSKIIILESDKSEINDLLSINSLCNYQPVLHNGINTIFKHKDVHILNPNDLPEGFDWC